VRVTTVIDLVARLRMVELNIYFPQVPIWHD